MAKTMALTTASGAKVSIEFIEREGVWQCDEGYIWSDCGDGSWRCQGMVDDAIADGIDREWLAYA